MRYTEKFDEYGIRYRVNRTCDVCGKESYLMYGYGDPDWHEKEADKRFINEGWITKRIVKESFIFPKIIGDVKIDCCSKRCARRKYVYYKHPLLAREWRVETIKDEQEEAENE